MDHTKNTYSIISLSFLNHDCNKFSLFNVLVMPLFVPIIRYNFEQSV